MRKYIYLMVVIAVLTCILDTGAFAVDPSTSLSKVQELAAQGEIETAYLLAQEVVRSLSRELNIGEIVVRSQLQLKESLKEVVTSSYSDSSSERTFSWSFRIDRNGVHLSVSRSSCSSNSSGETTEWITQNPEEVASFPLTIARDGANLEKELKLFLEKHVEQLFTMKVLGVWAMKLGLELIKAGDQTVVRVSELEEMDNLISVIRFYSEQTITLCLEKEFVDRYTSHSSHFSYDGTSKSSESSFREYAHRSKSCEAASIIKDMDVDRSAWAVDFRVIDRGIANWKKALKTLLLFRDLGENAPPSFGNPYLK